MTFKRHWRANQDKAQPVSEIPEQDNNVELTAGDNNDMNDNDNDNNINDINNADVEGMQRAPKRKNTTIDNTRVRRRSLLLLLLLLLSLCPSVLLRHYGKFHQE